MPNPNTANVYLPLNTYVSVQCYTNAAFMQRVTLTPEVGAGRVVTGNGEQNTPMPNGTFAITTPGSSSSPLGFRVTVAVESQQPNGSWAPSMVMSGSCTVMYFSLSMVVSEDYIDQDWNDAVVQFAWWIPPSGRDAARGKAIAAGR